MYKNKFNIHDKVYHLTPESDEGIITNWVYDRRLNAYKYEVTLGFNIVFWCYEDELSLEKVF